jgi:hypothetical protein
MDTLSLLFHGGIALLAASCGDGTGDSGLDAGDTLDAAVEAVAEFPTADICIPNCEGKVCGDDGCAGSCGECEAPGICSAAGLCECTPVCIGQDGRPYECGDDGCGGVCGNHWGDTFGDCCVDRKWICDSGDCEGKECGPDGIGGSCGSCPAGYVCIVDGICAEETIGPPCPIPVSDDVQKVTYLDFGSGGHGGEALDVDNNPDTCSPQGDCEGGLDNAFSAVISKMTDPFFPPNHEMQKAIDQGELVLLLDFVDPSTDGTPFSLNAYLGGLTSDRAVCDFQAAMCDYCAACDSLDPYTGLPLVSFDNATIDDGHLAAGGPEYHFQLMYPMSEAVVFVIAVENAQIAASVSAGPETMKLENGLIAGAVRKDKLMEAVDLLPEEELPVSPDTIKGILDTFVQVDIDTDEDGEADAASFAFKFSAIPGTLVGQCVQ